MTGILLFPLPMKNMFKLVYDDFKYDHNEDGAWGELHVDDIGWTVKRMVKVKGNGAGG